MVKEDKPIILTETQVEELISAAQEEGCEWGESIIPLCSLYYRMKNGCFSDGFCKALHKELILCYNFMLENTELVEVPEKIIIKKHKKREWVY